jgi:hypothetical protein
MAYIPARRGKIGRESFLSRPRFLALGEFGPTASSITKAASTASPRPCSPSRAGPGGRGRPAATEVARLCPACGYGHFRTSATPTAACRAAPLADARRCKTSTASKTSRPSEPSASPPTRKSGCAKATKCRPPCSSPSRMASCRWSPPACRRPAPCCSCNTARLPPSGA